MMLTQQVQQKAKKHHTEQIRITKPYEFSIIPKFALNNTEYRFPYLYRPDSWSCMITVGSHEIPVRILALKERKDIFLDVTMYDSVSSKEVKHILATLKHSFNTDLNLQSFYRHAHNDDKLQRVVSSLKGLKPLFALDPYHSLIRTVLRQLVSAKAASQFMTNLVNILGNSVVIDGIEFYGMPSPERLARASKRQLISCKVGYKWKLIKTLAQDIVDGDLDFKELGKKSDDYIIERLQEYSGIGDWTAKTFLYDGMGRLDSYPKYDITLVKTISQLYYRNKKISNDEVDKFFAKYSKYHGIVIPYLFGYQWLKRCGVSN